MLKIRTLKQSLYHSWLCLPQSLSSSSALKGRRLTSVGHISQSPLSVGFSLWEALARYWRSGGREKPVFRPPLSALWGIPDSGYCQFYWCSTGCQNISFPPDKSAVVLASTSDPELQQNHSKNIILFLQPGKGSSFLLLANLWVALPFLTPGWLLSPSVTFISNS